jgi:tripartite-type tricarboxylate transporter receptor subunit TctC
MSEFLPGFEASSWYGVAAPRNAPAEIVDKLNREINAALIDSKVKAKLADLGGSILGGSPADFGRLITDETEKWAKVIRAANISFSMMRIIARRMRERPDPRPLAGMRSV